MFSICPQCAHTLSTGIFHRHQHHRRRHRHRHRRHQCTTGELLRPAPAPAKAIMAQLEELELRRDSKGRVKADRFREFMVRFYDARCNLRVLKGYGLTLDFIGGKDPGVNLPVATFSDFARCSKCCFDIPSEDLKNPGSYTRQQEILAQRPYTDRAFLAFYSLTVGSPT